MSMATTQAMPSTAYDVELRGVTKRFGSFTAVQDVSFGVPRGAFFSILGPSGCGKTTLLKLISGFEDPTEGEVLITGKPMTGVAPNQRKVNMVFQRLALFPLMSVFDNVAFGLRMAKVSRSEVKARVSKILDTVGLTGLENRMPGQLSGGQQQRVAIARCLVLEPAVVLLDEPLSALDLKLREQMKLQLKHLQNEVGTTFVYITHDQSEALVMSDYVAVMNEGRVLQVGEPDQVYSHPADPFVASFVGESNRFEGIVTHMQPPYAQVQAGAFDFKVPMTGGFEVGQSLLLFVRPEQVRLYSDPDSATNLQNQVRGGVKEVIFDGAVVRCMVDVNHHDPISVLLTRSSSAPVPYQGETVWVGWHPNDVICFPSLHLDQKIRLNSSDMTATGTS